MQHFYWLQTAQPHFDDIPRLFPTQSSAAVIKLVAGVAQLVAHQPITSEIVGSIPTWDKIFPHGCTHFGIRGGMESSHLGFGWEGNSKTAQP